MATKTELQELCLATSEQFLKAHDIHQLVQDWRVNEWLDVTGVKAGTDVRFQTRFNIVTDSESSGVFESSGTTADFAVWLTTRRKYGEFNGYVFETDPDHPVRVPILVAEIMGDDFTQMHFPSTSEMEFDEEDSPYICRTNLPFLRHRLHPSTRTAGQLFISDYAVELVPARADANILSTDDEISEEQVQYAVRFTLADVLSRASGHDFDVREPVQ